MKRTKIIQSQSLLHIIETINAKKKEEYIWHQFRLSLDGKRMCDGCHSFITSDVPPIYERKNKADFLVGFLPC